jgi:hypothetical protein
MKGNRPVARLKPRGFRLFGREVQDYAQTATMAALLHLLLGFTATSRVMLVEAAHTLGNLGLGGAIKMTTHATVAMTALEGGIEAAIDAEPGEGELLRSS